MKQSVTRKSQNKIKLCFYPFLVDGAQFVETNTRPVMAFAEAPSAKCSSGRWAVVGKAPTVVDTGWWAGPARGWVGQMAGRIAPALAWTGLDLDLTNKQRDRMS